MMGLAILLLAVAAFWAFVEWRSGLLLCLATAILQDPLRKLTPGEPIIFVAFVGVVFGAACLGAWMGGVRFAPSSIFGHDRRIAVPMRLLLLLIVLEALNSFLRYGNSMITLIGLLTYLLPLPSIIFAYQLVHYGSASRVLHFMKTYLLWIVLALTTVYLDYAGYHWPVFGQVGGDLQIYDKYVHAVIIPYSGIFRAPEIAAWHAMTCACFALLLVTVRKFNAFNLLTAIVVVGLLLGIAVLTGRRKAVVEVAVFMATYFVLWFVLQRGAEKLGIVLIVAGLVGFSWWAAGLSTRPAYVVDEKTVGYYNYVERSKNVFEDVPARVTELAIAPVMWAYNRYGVFGAGLGVGTQGAQHFAGGQTFGGASEGGLGKITLELGVPGLLLMGWLAILVFNYVWQIMRDASQVSPEIARLSYGLFSFLVANVAAFSVATQAFGDIFILLILSWMLGFLLAVPVMLKRELRAQRQTLLKQPIKIFGTA
jgi:hypothetical protein